MSSARRRSLTWPVAVCASLLAAALDPADADAQPSGAAAAENDPREQARALYKKGTLAAQRGKLDEAARLFAAAAALVPHAATHVAAGRSFLASKDEISAADHFARALAIGAPEAERADVEKSLASLRERLGWVEVQGEAGSAKLDDREALALPAVLHGVPGPHTVRFTIDGRDGDAQVTLEAGKATELRPSLEVEAPPPPPPPTPPPPPPERGPSPLLLGGFVGLGVGVIGGGVTLGLGLAANGAKDDFLASRTQADFDAATGLQTGTNVALAVSVGAAVVGGALVTVALLIDDEAPVEATAGGAAWRF